MFSSLKIYGNSAGQEGTWDLLREGYWFGLVARLGDLSELRQPVDLGTQVRILGQTRIILLN